MITAEDPKSNGIDLLQDKAPTPYQQADPAEREADRVADAVVNGGSVPELTASEGTAGVVAILFERHWCVRHFTRRALVGRNGFGGR